MSYLFNEKREIKILSLRANFCTLKGLRVQVEIRNPIHALVASLNKQIKSKLVQKFKKSFSHANSNPFGKIGDCENLKMSHSCEINFSEIKFAYSNVKTVVLWVGKEKKAEKGSLRNY